MYLNYLAIVNSKKRFKRIHLPNSLKWLIKLTLNSTERDILKINDCGVREKGHFIVLFLGRFILLSPVNDAVVVVHHAQNLYLVGRVNRGHRNVPHRSELTAIVEVFVLQTEEVPNESKIYFSS